MDSSQAAFPKQSLNEPPRIFGNYSSDGSMLAPSYAGPIFTDDISDFGHGYGGFDLSDPAEAKRRRIARACDLCRRRKIKCDGKSPCAHCTNYSTECVYHFEQKARKPAKTAKYIEGLENRLGRMEHLLRLSGLLGEDEEGRTDLGALEQRLAERASSDRGSVSTSQDQLTPKSRRKASQQGTPTSGRSPPSRTSSTPPTLKSESGPSTDKTNPREVDDLAELMDSLVTNNHGETRYIGSSSGLSIFSPKGIQWVSEKTGDTSFIDMIKSLSVDDNKWFHWKPEVFGDIFQRRVYRPLPPKEECFSLLTDFFESFNNMFPLFHEPTFMHLVDMQYSTEPYQGSGWWASLNVALAIAWRIRIVKDMIPASRESSDWAYFKNALGVLSELTMRNTDLLSVQALLGMCLFLQGTPNPQPSFFLLGAALRLAHSIGLHKRGSGHGFNALEIEQRKRVFWIAYMLDKDMCLRSGRPPAQDDQDWNVELPTEDPDDGVGSVPLPDGSGGANLFRKMCEFSVISSQVYNRLYSVKASKQSDGELLNTIGELDQQLEQWKDSIPLCFRPDHEIDSSNPQLTLHLAVLHFAYYNCLTTIHRRSVLHGYWSSRLAQFAIEGRNAQPLNHRVFSSAALCVSAARMSISLLKYIPPGDYSCVWLILYYPVSALVTLFSNILQNPQDPRARPDLKLMRVVVNFLEHIVAEDKTGSIERMYSVCKEFDRIAGVVLDKAEKDMSTRQKRKQERDREKIEKSTLDQQQRAMSSNARQSIANTEDLPPQNLHELKTSNSISSSDAFTTPYQQNGVLQDPSATTNGFDPDAFAGYDQSQNYDTMLNDPLLMGMNDDMNNMNNMNNMPLFADDELDAATNAAINHAGSFQQPFLPQDMWSMPMTFEWDWADMSNMPAI